MARKRYYEYDENGKLVWIDEDLQPELQPEVNRSQNAFGDYSQELGGGSVIPPAAPTVYGRDEPFIVPPAASPAHRSAEPFRGDGNLDVISAGFGSELNNYNDQPRNLGRTAYGNSVPAESTRGQRTPVRARDSSGNRGINSRQYTGITPRFGHRRTTIYLVCLLASVALIALSIWLHSIGFYIGF